MSLETAKSKLSKYDIKLAIDKSGSMDDPNRKTGTKTSRWAAVQESTISLARHCAPLDDDGISVCVFASKIIKEYENIDDSIDKIKAIFTENSPGGGTFTHLVVKHYADVYLAAKAKGEAKPVMLVIITDGIPESESELCKEIANLTKKLTDKEEFRILFIQAGDDEHAHAFLKRIDEKIEGATMDIVHCVTFDEIEEKAYEVLLEEALEEAA